LKVKKQDAGFARGTGIDTIIDQYCFETITIVLWH